MDQYPFERGGERHINGLAADPRFYERKDERHTGRDPFHFLWGYMKPYKRFLYPVVAGACAGKRVAINLSVSYPSDRG